MIKALIGNKGNKPMLILGLEAKNMAMLLLGKPILFDMRPFGFEGHCTIMGGQTLDDVVVTLREHGIDLPDLHNETEA